MTKTYTLELTAEELWSFAADTAAAQAKIQRLRDQERADREADELRLPWEITDFNQPWLGKKAIRGAAGFAVSSYAGERAAKLMSAAPELLAAVTAVVSYMEGFGKRDIVSGYWSSVRPVIDRALRKVETGVPE